jgi:hypothetical protein
MPFNGSGVFQRVRNWVADATAGIKIRADYHDAEDDNFAAGLSNCIARDGQSTISQNIPFNNKRITGLADPVNPQDAATKASSVAKIGDIMTGPLMISAGTAGTMFASSEVRGTVFGLAANPTMFYIDYDTQSIILHGGNGVNKYGIDFQNGAHTVSWASIGPAGMRVLGSISSNGAAALDLQNKLLSSSSDPDGPDIFALVAALLARIEVLESRMT